MGSTAEFHVSLVSPPGRSDSSRPPLGLMYLAAHLRSCLGWVSVDIIDIKQGDPDKKFQEIIRRLGQRLPRVVGISCLSTEVGEVKTLARMIKEMDAQIKIVVGGIHPTLFPAYFFTRFDLIDFVVVGEGETTLVELVDTLKNGGDLSGIRGIGYKKDFQFILNGKRNAQVNLDHYPLPAYDLVDMDFYTQPSEWVIRGVPISGFFIFTSRGCPYKCRFCVNKNLAEKKVRYRSAKNIVDEIEYLADHYRIDGFFIYDDTFGLDKKGVFALCDELIRRRLKLVWGCQARANLLSEQMIKKMKQAGCIQLEFGVESGSQRMLEYLNKRIKVADVVHVFGLCDKYRIRKLANFLINAPTETWEDIEKTLDLAQRIRANVNLFNVTTLFPGSDLYYAHGQHIPESHLIRFASQDDFNDFLNLIETRYKLSEHQIPISRILDMAAEKFPTRSRISFKWEKGYLIQLYKLGSFIFSWHYIRALLTSKQKIKYLTYARSILSRLHKGW